MKCVTRSLVVLLTFAPTTFSPSLARAEGPAARAIVLGDCLVIPPVERYGRVPLPIDFLQAEIVAGNWKAPKAGDKLALSGGATRTWEAATAKDGALAHAALNGGYLFWPVHLDASRVMLLEASGHATAYVNGEPRAGDPYSNGLVRLPVA